MTLFFEDGWAGAHREAYLERYLWLPEFRDQPRRPFIDNATLKEAESFYYEQRPFADRDEFALAESAMIESIFRVWLEHDAPQINDGLYSVLIADAPKPFTEARAPLEAFAGKFHREWTIGSRVSYPQFVNGLSMAQATAAVLIRGAAVGEPREFYSGVQLIDDRVAELSAAAPELVFSVVQELEEVKRNRFCAELFDYAVKEYGEEIYQAVKLLTRDLIYTPSLSEPIDTEAVTKAFKKALPSLL
jgi:hypothetical protein